MKVLTPMGITLFLKKSIFRSEGPPTSSHRPDASVVFKAILQHPLAVSVPTIPCGQGNEPRGKVTPAATSRRSDGSWGTRRRSGRATDSHSTYSSGGLPIVPVAKCTTLYIVPVDSLDTTGTIFNYNNPVPDSAGVLHSAGISGGILGWDMPAQYWESPTMQSYVTRPVTIATYYCS